MTASRQFISVDLFAGGGGASAGIRAAVGRCPIVAVNHDANAIEMHARNHPSTIHLQTSVHDVGPGNVMDGRPLDLLWLSPDCTHFSRAKGGKPKKKEIRDLARVAIPWAREVRPTVIALENVPEFTTWGPLDEKGQPIPERAGEDFRAFVSDLEAEGYAVEWRTLVAADYGAPTTRKRLFLVARRDGRPIVWPEPTHGPGRPLPWRTTAEIIDWSIPVPSIFLTSEEAKAQGFPRIHRPLAEKTQARIAEGLRRYVLESADPFIVPLRGTSPSHKSVHGMDRPLSTVSAQGTHHALVAPTLIQTGYGERKGQRPRALDIQAPLGTVVATGQKHALVAAWLAKHYGGVVGHDVRRPLGTITATDHHAVCQASLEPESTDRSADVAAFLVKYYGSGGQWQDLREPLHTIVAKARFGLVTVDLDGVPYTITDIGMRMLQPRELARAQGFDDSYVLTGTKTEQVARIGNSVPPQLVEAIVSAQFEGVTLPASQPDLFREAA